VYVPQKKKKVIRGWVWSDVRWE